MANDYFNCRYELEDGYVGGSRPQTFRVRAADLEDDVSDEALEQAFHAMAEEHRNENIGIASLNIDEFKQWARAQVASRS